MKKDKTIQDILVAAEKGDSQAQQFLADAYMKGNGVKRNYGQAVYWIRKATAASDLSKR